MSTLSVGDRAFRAFRSEYYHHEVWQRGLKHDGVDSSAEVLQCGYLDCPIHTHSRIAVEPLTDETALFGVGSVLGICYTAVDAFDWHTDESGDAGPHAGWLVSVSFGASATFEYKAPVSAKGVAPDVFSVNLRHGDCLFSNGGVLEHRIAAVDHDRAPESFKEVAGQGIARLNLQIRKYGVSDAHTCNALRAEAASDAPCDT